MDNLARYGEDHYWMLRYEDLVVSPGGQATPVVPVLEH